MPSDRLLAGGRKVATPSSRRLERAMSSQWGSRLSDQVQASSTAPGAEAVSWGSADALDAVKRVCHGVALRCHQAIATHHSGDAPEPPASAANSRRRSSATHSADAIRRLHSSATVAQSGAHHIAPRADLLSLL